MSIEGKKYFVIGSLEKGVRVMELLAEREALTVSEVAAALSINRSASHRFLATLKELGYVARDDKGKYRLTFRILEQAMKMADRFEIRPQARPFLLRLSALTRETVNLGYWDGGQIVHLDKIDSENILRMDSRIGSRAPAYCTALGKAILAFLPESEIGEYLDRAELTPMGPRTIVSPDALKAELKRIREAGYAVDDEEMAPGLRCVAAPVFDYSGVSRYALSVSGQAMRIDYETIGKIEGEIRKACKELSRIIGGSEGKP